MARGIGLRPSTKSEPRYLLTGGGTAGHVYPGLALANHIQGREPGAQFLFVGARGGAEERIVPAAGYPLRTLGVRGLPVGRDPRLLVRTLWRLCVSVAEASRILRAFRPGVVVGMGGYASAPVLLAALLLRALRLWEGTIAIHEQNIVPGRFNRWMARWVDFTGTSFPDTCRLLATQKAHWSAYPLRAALAEVAAAGPDIRSREREQARLPGDARVILIFGGSSGARAINRALLEALPGLLTRKDLYVLHAFGYPQGDYDPAEETRAALASTLAGLPGVAERYRPQPYFDPIEAYYRIADVVVGRAGAGSVWEVAAAGLPAVLIPKSNLPGDHQVKNARFMERHGLARVLYERRNASTDEADAEVVDPGELTEMILSSLATVSPSRNRVGRPEWLDPEAGARRFYALLAASRAGRRFGNEDERAPSGPFPGQSLDPGSSLRLEWISGARMLAELESAWRDRVALSEADRKYGEYRAEQLVASSRWQDRNIGVKMAGLVRHRALLPALLRCINDRRAAPWSHRLLGGDFREVGFVRRNALQALWRLETYDEQVRRAILTALKDPYFEVRSWSARAVGRFSGQIGNDPEMEERLRANLQDRWFEVIVSSLEALGRICRNPDLLPELVVLLEHKNWKVQEAAVRCLMRLIERDVVALPPEARKWMRKVPMKGLDFSPQFPLRNTWEAFQILYSKKAASEKSPNPHTGTP